MVGWRRGGGGIRALQREEEQQRGAGERHRIGEERRHHPHCEGERRVARLQKTSAARTRLNAISSSTGTRAKGSDGAS